ncbi:MAG: Precorrin-3B methylase [Merismopedia sp. SIO2A8]|nr:Precorrin-3B methylase [Symploca sp. SIO2B6]NET51028.1 Precorrin-3B methylase [Merismopedia sp. SIO2A8]
MKEKEIPLAGKALVKEVCRRIRVARSYWDAHNNAACRRERDRALQLYNTLTKEQKDQIPQVLRVWLRYRSEKYFGSTRTLPGKNRKRKSRKKPPF